MQHLQGFRYTTALDLNIGYYHIRLNPDTQHICTFILPWGKYKYKRLPMDLSVAIDIFQSEISKLVSNLEFAKAYLYNLLCLTSGSLNDHLAKLDYLFQRLSNTNLKINAEKSSFCTDKIEYLGYFITRNGITSLDNKTKEILALSPPKNLKELRRILGIVQYYRDLWEKKNTYLSTSN